MCAAAEKRRTGMKSSEAGHGIGGASSSQEERRRRSRQSPVEKGVAAYRDERERRTKEQARARAGIDQFQSTKASRRRMRKVRDEAVRAAARNSDAPWAYRVCRGVVAAKWMEMTHMVMYLDLAARSAMLASTAAAAAVFSAADVLCARRRSGARQTQKRKQAPERKVTTPRQR